MALPPNVLCYGGETTVCSENAKFSQQKGTEGSKRVNWLAILQSQPWLQGIELRHLGKREWWQQDRPELGVAMAGAKAVEFSAS